MIVDTDAGVGGSQMPEPEPLFVTCKNCKSQVPTGLRLTGAVYEIRLEERREFTCPNCGTVATYSKAEWHIHPEESRPERSR